ncbi:unnamed protein product [Linum trigynum]|uniref:Uncharacterized protein n=1 Tax=Linum trigynum TaxID=586398 RepID=A0AAV2EZ48_9ROSI
MAGRGRMEGRRDGGMTVGWRRCCSDGMTKVLTMSGLRLATGRIDDGFIPSVPRPLALSGFPVPVPEH